MERTALDTPRLAAHNTIKVSSRARIFCLQGVATCRCVLLGSGLSIHSCLCRFSGLQCSFDCDGFPSCGWEGGMEG